MMMRRSVIATFFVLTLAVLAPPVMATPTPLKGQPGSTARAFIEGMTNEAVQALTAEGVSRKERQIRFRNLLDANFDVPLIGKWVLGRYWRMATDDEKKKYLNLFEDYIVVTYVERFDQYKGKKLYVTKSVADPGRDALVYSKINRPGGGSPISINWRVRTRADTYKIIDVYVEGISMSQTQRKEFSSVIRNNGGKISALLKLLQSKVLDLTAR